MSTYGHQGGYAFNEDQRDSMRISKGDEPLDAEAIETAANVAEQVKTSMRLRDEFAMAALQGLLPKLPLVDQQGEHGDAVEDKRAHNRDIAESCYWLADAMLAARKAKLT